MRLPLPLALPPTLVGRPPRRDRFHAHVVLVLVLRLTVAARLHQLLPPQRIKKPPLFPLGGVLLPLLRLPLLLPGLQTPPLCQSFVASWRSRATPTPSCATPARALPTAPSSASNAHACTSAPAAPCTRTPKHPKLPLLLLLPLLALKVREVGQPFANRLVTGRLRPLRGLADCGPPLALLPPGPPLRVTTLLPHLEQPLTYPLHPRGVLPRMQYGPLALRYLLHCLQLVRWPLPPPLTGVRRPLVPLPLHKLRRTHLLLPLLPAGGGPFRPNLLLLRLPLRLPLLRLRLPDVLKLGHIAPTVPIKRGIPHTQLVSPRQGPSSAYVSAVYSYHAPRFYSSPARSYSAFTGRSYGHASHSSPYSHHGYFFARTGYHSYISSPSRHSTF